MRRIERRRVLPAGEFTAAYLQPGRPVIVTDVICRWPAQGRTLEEWIIGRLGDQLVQVYDDLFELTDICPLQDYLTAYWHGPAGRQQVPYVRWYARFKHMDFVWADAAFDMLAPYWHMPYFLPVSDYILPLQCHAEPADVVHQPFPGKGIFLSAVGGRTRLHRDPWCSDAVLCQVSGRKRVLLYAPHSSRNQAHSAVDFEDLLEPGEVLFIPCGWYHQVDVLTNSVALTWNFVHATHEERFRSYLRATRSPQEQAVLAFFLDGPLAAAFFGDHLVFKHQEIEVGG